VVVNFAVECDDTVAVLGNNRLVPGFEVYDLQTRRAKRNGVRFKYTLLVGPAMTERADDSLNAAWRGYGVEMSETADTAHLGSPVTLQPDCFAL